ncbi:MAG: 5-deoxy-glucuronate isomerase [Ilumatobacter sp.]|uniref:5-deoxy-glucuronate isomerase n=1 Tax=Ilumatobacter sp. TaxID=1967498 RepID=UPI002602A40F|nr:5-deoxy-glucuronate isomerase [Ilumatobacter sp.]MDJ0770189.1 5-deoxy-glucuronate isomerase [Ilumatobacter sp.]
MSNAARTEPIRPAGGPGTVIDVTPESAGWANLAFAVVDVRAGRPNRGLVAGRETAIVTLSGAGRVLVDGLTVDVGRSSVFDEVGRIVYVPPGVEYVVETDSAVTVSVGSAPAEGRLPTRVFEPSEMRSEIRGGGTSYRQVVHALAHPLPAEHLILYEVYVPRGTWAGWPPHRHDGSEGSPYLEEVYYFRLDRPEGYVLHRNFTDGHGPGDELDEVIVAGDGDVALVPKGYHTSVASPGSNMYFLNYLAGDLELDERRTPPCFHAEHTWIEADWDAGAWSLPVVPTT